MDTRQRAKQLRSNMTESERRLWFHLRAHRFAGQKFRRQQPIGPYVVDFVHFGAKLVVEADGGQHLDSDADAARDAWFQRHGFRVLRFWNHDILQDTQTVLEAIWVALEEALREVCSRPLSPGASPPLPRPLSRKGRGEQSESGNS